MTGFIDMMNRKLDKSAQMLNQLKIWKNSSDLLDLFLDIAKDIDMSRVFTVYLKVKITMNLCPHCHFKKSPRFTNKSI